MEAEEIAVAWWDALQARDWAGARALLDDEATLDWPCTEERFTGGDAIVAVNAAYPEGWRIAVLERGHMADGRAWVTARIDHGESRFYAVQRATVVDGRLRAIEEHWATAESPPAWREGLPGRTCTTPVEPVLTLVAPDPGLPSVRDYWLDFLRETAPEADIREVGSTVFADLPTKGDLDLLVRVPAEYFAATRRRLDRILRRNPDQLADAAYQGYLVPGDRDVAVQLTVAGGPYDDFVRFLDALAADDALRAAYGALKRRCAGLAMSAYRAEKARFVAEVLAR